jgi:hypothetical protein
MSLYRPSDADRVALQNMRVFSESIPDVDSVCLQKQGRL